MNKSLATAMMRLLLPT